MIADLAPEIVGLLILAAFFAGFVDSIAGGGGLIAMPALLLAGVGPVEALATNKLQGTFGSGTAAFTYASRGLVPRRGLWGMAGVALVCGGVGSALAGLVPADWLRVAMPVVLIAVALFFALKPGLTDADRVQRMAPGLFTVTVVPVLALYDGLFGPGTGSFYMVGFILLAGFGVLKATAQTKVVNFASNLGSLAVFAFGGHVLWGIGLAMGAAQIAGASLGARMAMRVGAGLIKPLLVVVCVGMAARLLWQEWG
jgi:uncharacterized membrane protein YfcA